MSAKTIRKALGTLQDDPDHAQAWSDLAEAVGFVAVGEPVKGSSGMPDDELTTLLEAARLAHEARREYDAVAHLLEMEVALAHGSERESELVAQLARVLDDEVLDDARSVAAYERMLVLRPGDAVAEEAIEKSTAKRAKWFELVSRYVQEAKAAADGAFKSSLLMSAAEVAYRYGRPRLAAEARESGKKAKRLAALLEQIEHGLKEAIEIDPKNRRAGLLLERIYREQGDYEAVARILEQIAAEATAKEEKIATFVRLARVLSKKLSAPERAVAAYERVLDLSPGHQEATSALVDFFTAHEMWDHLVALYEEQLAASRGPQEAGMVLQIAMVNWKMRGKAEAAEPYFERLRRFEPAHPGMLSFFREWSQQKGASGRLASVLNDAYRVLPDGKEKRQLAAELAKLAEEGANAAKAIEQWRALLRQDPTNEGAHEALKRLYKQTAGWNALTDLLRNDLERVPADDPAGRLPILREIAEIYREHIKSDSALVTVLSQIIALDKEDAKAVRELARVYEALGRWRDLLATQTRLAELEQDAGAKAELYRVVARRWLEQFSNVQNATDAYEKLHEILPRDREAYEKRKELYSKRRAYKPLYDLLEREAEAMEEGPARREVWIEMARLAAERLDRGAAATALYKRILEEDPKAAGALDALEKQAERDKDYKTVAEVLERRAAAGSEAGDSGRLAVLQKLGVIYAERLANHQGAMRTWRRVLELSPGHAKALRVLRDSYLAVGDYVGLTDLYAANNDWEGLAEVLSGAADRAADNDTKVDLSFRAAEVYVAKLKAPERAFRAYERILAVRPDDVKAAAALVPLYEKDDKWSRLPPLYEVLLDRAESDEERLALLEKLSRVVGTHLQDKKAAFAYARRAYDLDPERSSALAAFEGAARAADEWGQFVDVLNARLKQKKVKKEDKRILRAKLAEVCATELGRVDESVAAYKNLVEEDETDHAALETLDRILRAADRKDDLRWLFDVRIERANTAAKIEILGEWAVLEEEAFAAPDRAIDLYRRMLELVPQHGGALRSLARLLRAAGDAEGAVEIIERDRDQRRGAERAAREVEAARLYVDPLKRYGAALAAAKRALEDAPGDRDALSVVEELLSVGETRARAAVILEAAYEAEGDFARQAEVLEVMIATAASKTDRIALFGRLADVYEKLGAVEKAFDVVARVASEFPTELPFWDRLSVLANRTQRSQQFVDAIAQAVPATGETGLPLAVELDLAERAATLYDEKLGEIDRAQPYLERILERDPSNERAFVRLKQILTTREKWGELEALYERAVSATDDAPRRADLLSEVALIAEEITGDREKAMHYYERILALDPLHDQAVRALDALYVATERWDKLAGLLKRCLGRATMEEAVSLKLRLGTIYFTHLGDPASALEQLEEVLAAEVSNREARDLVERCLTVADLRARAASVLEGVYVARDEVRDLVRVLEIRLEFAAAGPDRRDLLARVAQLRDERLQDDQGAFDTLARLVPMDPDDVPARTRMLEIARRLGAHERAAEVLVHAAAQARTPQPRAEILSDVAHVYEDLLDDPARAEAVYKEVLAIDPHDALLALPAARSLERIYSEGGRHADLANTLKVEVDLEENSAARRDLYGRLGELCETVLEDPAGAIEAWKARLEDDPADEPALAALDRLYERTGDYRALVDVLRAREPFLTEGAARKALLTRIATTLGDKLHDVLEATLAYRSIVDEFGPERGTLAALEKLYEHADRWQDLADTLEADLSLSDTPEDRLALLARLGRVRQLRLGNVEASIEAYRQALSIHPAHGESRGALEALLADADARREAATILRPLYESEAEHTRLLRVLDIEAEFAETAAGKLAIYARAVSVAEGPLGNPVRAFSYASRGVREAAQEPEFATWLERAERLTAATGNYTDLVALLRSVIPDIVDGDQQLEVTLKVATLARGRLQDRDLARSYYQKALELRADERRALEALESLYEESGDAPALLDVLKRRAEAAESEAERQNLLFKEARICDELLRDQPAAIDVYEQILEIAPEERAIAALERLYAATERYDDLIALYERQIGQDNVLPSRKASLHHSLGVVFETRQRDVDRAFDQYEAALRIDPQHEPTITSLEGLMGNRDHASRAAEMLEGVYLARLDWRRVMATLEARLESNQDPEGRRLLLRRLAQLHEEQEEDYRAALETTAKLLHEDVADESTWAELERLARVANAEGRLAEILAAELDRVESDEPATARLAKRTGELFEAQNDVDRALKFYKRAYSFAPEEGDGSFEAVDRLLREANRPAERVSLYREALDHRTDASERLATLHTIALLEEAELHDDDRAIETYRAALDIDDGDQHSLEALSRLYARRERWRDLADLTRRRAEQSALPEDEARFRLELGHLLENKLGSVSAAIDEYQAAVDLTPVEAASLPGSSASRAVLALEALVSSDEHKARVVEILRPIYERADDWRHLVGVNAERLTLASDSGEKVAILRESAKLWEERGLDRIRAFEAVRDAFVIDPDDGDTRGELDRLSEATKRWDDLAAAYEQGISKTEGISQKELLLSLARVHDTRRDDPRAALAAYDRLFKLDETDIEPLEAMDTLATLLSDWQSLVRMLAKKAELIVDDEERARTWRRIGETRRDMLDDVSGAIDAYERALELEPESAFTLDCLIALYEEKEDALRLVNLYRRRVEQCGEGDEDRKYELLMLAARRYETGALDAREAIQLLNEAIVVRPGDPDAMRRLDELYTHERLWPELYENLRLQAGAASDEASRRTIKKRIGALLADELEDPQKALEAYREVLDGGFDEEAIRAIRKMGEAHEELRADAADALEPVLRAAGRNGELADSYEMRLRAQTDAHDRARTLRAIAEVAETHLSDVDRAENALLRAIAEEPDDAALHADIERIAARLGEEGWRRYADTLGERASSTFDAALTTDLYVRLGRVAEDRLHDDARAAKAYAQAAEQSGDSAPILEALDRILSRMGDARGLVDVLERRVAVEAEATAQSELYHRLASLLIDEFAEKARGLAALRLALERKPDHGPSREALEGLLNDPLLFDEAFETLESVYRQLGSTAELAKLYERRVARSQELRDRTRARLELARVLETDVRDSARAQHVVQEAINEDPSDGQALEEVERLAKINDRWADAAAAFEHALRGTHEFATGTLSELWVRLAQWRRDELADARGAEGAFAEARRIDPDNLDVLSSIEALQRTPGRERDLVATLRARAKLETIPSTKRDLLREAKALAESTVGDRELAEETLRDLLSEDEADLWALEELTRLRDEAGDNAEVVKILLRRAELAADGAEVLELKHRAADTLVKKLGDRERAIALYEEVLEQEPADASAPAKLRALYEEAGRDRDLAKLVTHLIDTADSASRRSRLRLDLAELQYSKFESPKDAAETLRAVLDDEPGHAEAVVALSQLLEKTGQDEELAELLHSQVERAKERGDAESEVALEVRLGEVFEGRLKDSGRALATYEAVLDKNPEHRGALEAVARLSEARFDWARVASALGKIVDLATDKSGVPEALRLAMARMHLEDQEGVEHALKRALELDATNVEVRGQLRGLYERGKKWTDLANLLVGDADLIATEHPELASAAGDGGAGGALPLSGPLGEQVKVLRRAADIHVRERKAPADAVPILERAAALAPLDRELLLQLVDAYTVSGREREAASVLERVIASFGNRRTKELSLYHHRLGRALASLGDKDVALLQYDMAFKIDPGSVSVLKDLGVLALETNDLDRAQKTFRALLLQRLEPSTGITKGEVFYYLGEISAKQGDKAKAVQMLERAIENEPSLDRARTKLMQLKG